MPDTVGLNDSSKESLTNIKELMEEKVNKELDLGLGQQVKMSELFDNSNTAIVDLALDVLETKIRKGHADLEDFAETPEDE